MSSNALKESPKTNAKVADLITPNWRQHAKSIQKYGTVVKDLPIGLDASERQEIVGRLNLVLADQITLPDLYKK
jgi:starvation-inducible DNA-binding protein